ncbi:hypothetical protein FRB97_005656, partial [Tulasnella sp. 331]
WWQERGVWKHQYVVVKATPQQGSGTRYFRVERHKTKWLALRKPNILNYVTHSETFQDLTRDSILIADFYVTDTEFARRSDYNIQSLGSLVELINREAPIYALGSVNLLGQPPGPSADVLSFGVNLETGKAIV